MGKSFFGGGGSGLGGILGGGGGGGGSSRPLTEAELAARAAAQAEAERKAKYQTYTREHEGDDIPYDQWLSWQDLVANKEPFVPREYNLKSFEQQPVAPPPGPVDPAKIINKYLENIMSNVGSPTSGQTEVGKALRATNKAEGK